MQTTNPQAAAATSAVLPIRQPLALVRRTPSKGAQAPGKFALGPPNLETAGFAPRQVQKTKAQKVTQAA